MRQHFAVNAEVAEAAPLIVDDAVALARHGDEAGPLAQLRPLQGPEQVPCDSVNQARALWRARPKQDSGLLFSLSPTFINTFVLFIFYETLALNVKTELK